MKRIKIPRYELEQELSCGKPIAKFKLNESGEWVYFSDVSMHLKTGLYEPTSSERIKCPKCDAVLKVKLESIKI